ncbi:MAG: hypothetical protein L3J44_02935 [Campylobacteraceae bacterium]|nr:hypothetical protein [Campylobacteraceae bacterium]
MAKIDEVKEFIGFLKAVFITTIVIMSSLVAYLYDKPMEDNYLALLALIIDIIVLLVLLKTILNHIKMLKDL